MRTSVRRPGSRKTYTVTHHRIVAEALLPNPEGKEDVNHKDGDKANNHPSNLEWATRSENMSHAWGHRSPGSFGQAPGIFGSAIDDNCQNLSARFRRAVCIA